MRKFCKIQKAYWCFTKTGFKTAIAYRSELIGYFIGESLYNIALIFVWKALFLNTGNTAYNGFTFTQIVLYLLLSGIMSFMDESDSLFILGEEIRDGNIVMRLIKPVSLDKSILYFELGNKLLMLTCVFVPSVVFVGIYFNFAYGITFPVSSYVLFSLSMIISYFISFYFNMLFGFLSFYLLNLWGVSMLKTAVVKFLSGQVIPLFLFPEIVEKVFSILPMAAMTYTPVMIFLGKYSRRVLLFNLAVQIFWLFFFYSICQIIWKRVQHKLMVQGG